MSHPFSREPLWNKAKLFMERGLVARSEGKDEEWPLWASLAAELLGKAVLAKIHPVLVAHPGDEDKANSLLSAAGVDVREGGLLSIPMKTVLSRLALILPAEFDSKVQKGLKVLADLRNEELHSGATPFTDLKEHAWAPAFWRATDVLLRELGKSAGDFVGRNYEHLVVGFIAATKRESEDEVKKRLGEAKERWKVRSNDNGGEQAYRELVSKQLILQPRYIAVACPVCGCRGLLGHSEVLLTTVRRAEEDHLETDERYRAETFRCAGCSLQLNGTAHLALAGLPVDVVETSDIDYSDMAGDAPRFDNDPYGND